MIRVRGGMRLGQCLQVEAMLNAGKSVFIARRGGGIGAKLNGDHCEVEFIAPNTSWRPVTELYGIVDELREISPEMLDLMKRRA